MDLDEKFEKIVNAEAWKKNLDVTFSTRRYHIRVESIAHLPKQTAIVAKHSHVLYKLRYFSGGSGILSVDGKLYPVSPNTFFTVAPGVPHSQIHSEKASADEYTVFIEIEQVKRTVSSENEAVFRDLDRVLDIIVKCPFYYGIDKHGVGECMKRIIGLLSAKHGVNLSVLWIELMQMILAAAKNISELPALKEEKTVLPADSQRASILDSVFRSYHDRLTRGDVANMLGVSVRQLDRITEKLYGSSFKQKYTSSRMELATTLLEQAPELSVDEISRKLNFSSENYFAKCFKEFYGMTPKEYRLKYKKTAD